MPIKFKCMYCGRQYKVEESNAGKSFKCKQCSHTVKVPKPKPESPEPKPRLAEPLKAVASGKPKVGAPVAAATATANETKPQQLPPVSTSQHYGADIDHDVYAGPAERRLNLLLMFGVGVVLLGMALPWISVPPTLANTSHNPGYVSGFQLPFFANDEIDEGREEVVDALTDSGANYEAIELRLKTFDAVAAPFRWLYAVLLIPIAVLLAALDEWYTARYGKNRWYMRAIAALTPIIVYGFVVLIFGFTFMSMGAVARTDSAGSEGSSGIMDFVGIGFWIVPFGSLLLLISIFTSPTASNVQDDRPKPRRPQSRPVEAPIRTGLPVKPKRPPPKLPRPR